jgi:CRISPR-associated protein Csm5
MVDGVFAVIDQEALFRSAPEFAENFMQRLISLTPDEIQRANLAQMIPGVPATRQEFQRYRCALTPYVKGQLDRARERGQAEVRVVTKTPDNCPYLPGSSLKGALRTALAYAWIKGDRNALDRLKRAPTREKWRTVEGMLRVGGDADVTRDVLRALEVGDSQSLLAEDTLAVDHEAVLSAAVRRGSNSPGDSSAVWKGFPTFVETIKPGVVLDGRIILRDRLLAGRAADRLGWDSRQRGLVLGDVLKAANVLAGDAIAWELRFLARVTRVQVDSIRQFYRDLSERARFAPDNEAYLCLGRGAGWHKSTVGLLLEQAEDFDFARFRREGGTAERRGAGFDRTDFDFPKTRKFVMQGPGRPFGPLGWVRLVLLDLPAGTGVASAALVKKESSESSGQPHPRPEPPTERGAQLASRARPARKADLEALRQSLEKSIERGQGSERTTKASEKAKREQERIARRYRGDPEPKE